MERSESALVRRYVDGGRVPKARVLDILHAEFNRHLDARDDLSPAEMTLRVLDEVRPERRAGGHRPAKDATGS